MEYQVRTYPENGGRLSGKFEHIYLEPKNQTELKNKVWSDSDPINSIEELTSLELKNRYRIGIKPRTK